MPSFLSPVYGAGAQLFDNQGIVLSGGKIYTYQAGTTIPLATFTDSTDTVQNANPLILDSAGRVTTEIWLEESSTYKFIITDANNNILGTWDNVAGVNDISISATASEWSATGLLPSYISGTSFSVLGNNTSIFTLNRRVQATVSAGTIYGYVVSSSFGAGITTVVIQPDSTTLDSGLSVINVGFLGSVNLSTPQQLQANNATVNVTAAATTLIGAANSSNVNITGAATITAFDNVVAGILKFARFAGISTLTHNATSLILPNAANIVTAVGDHAIFRSLGSGNWDCIGFFYATRPYALENGDAAEIFSVANATAAAHAVRADLPVGDMYSITCTMAGNALTFTLNPCVIRFRNNFVTLGNPNTRFVTSAITVVVPSGATLGTVTTLSARIILVAIDNAGTVELAVIQRTNGTLLNETGLVTTTAIGTGSDSLDVFYSTTARTSLPYKVLGFVDAVNTAGAWSTPTFVQNVGRGEFLVMNYDEQILTADGTWTKPAWCLGNEIVEIELWAGGGAGGTGGGGGASGGAGGGAGAYQKYRYFASALPPTAAIVVGAGGTATAGNGNPGGDTTFIGTGISLTANNGTGGGTNGGAIGVGGAAITGAATAGINGGNGGTGGSLPLYAVSGTDGGTHITTHGGGGGAASGTTEYPGGGGGNGGVDGAAGTVGIAPGGGGGGGGATSGSGAAGARGAVRVQVFS